LLNQQYTAASARREKVYENHFALIFRLVEGSVYGPLKPILSGCGGCEDEEEKRKNKFLLHVYLLHRTKFKTSDLNLTIEARQ